MKRLTCKVDFSDSFFSGSCGALPQTGHFRTRAN
ncbi:unnamed protein product [Tenebrio molitor]|nr:unnamed protein product [Tenebrio molitor]